jgi:hypothetical protein
MATATVKRPAPIPPPPEIVLTLSLEEAAVLKAVVGNVAGRSALRDYTNLIWSALCEVVEINYADVFTTSVYLRDIEAGSLHPRLTKPG